MTELLDGRAGARGRRATRSTRSAIAHRLLANVNTPAELEALEALQGHEP